MQKNIETALDKKPVEEEKVGDKPSLSKQSSSEYLNGDQSLEVLMKEVVYKKNRMIFFKSLREIVLCKNGHFLYRKKNSNTYVTIKPQDVSRIVRSKQTLTIYIK